MHSYSNTAYSIRFLLLSILVIVLFLAAIIWGSVTIPIQDVYQSIIGTADSTSTHYFIIEYIRLPKAITAVLAGSALSVSGLMMQTLFRNPLASPSELGVSSGATLGISTLFLTNWTGIGSVTALQQMGVSMSWITVVMAALGAAMVLACILFIAQRVKNNVIVLIAGVMIGTLTLSITSVGQYLSQPEQLQAFILWTFGSLGNVAPDQLRILIGIVLVTLIGTYALSKTLNVLVLGEQYAESLGTSIRNARLLILLFTSILTGAITAFCGPIGFIGIAVPHLTRSLFKTADHRILLPASALLGAALLLACDIVTHLPGLTFTLPINVITSIIGAPIVIWIIMRLNNVRNAF